MKRTMSWALGAVLLLTCATAVWSQQDENAAAKKKPKPPAGTITGVIAGTDLTGGGTTGTVTLNLDTTKVPQLGAANTFTANQTVNGSVTATNVSATGTVTGGVVNAANVNATGTVNSGVVNATTSFDIGGTPFAFGAYGPFPGNAFLGFAGNATTTGTSTPAAVSRRSRPSQQVTATPPAATRRFTPTPQAPATPPPGRRALLQHHGRRQHRHR